MNSAAYRKAKGVVAQMTGASPLDCVGTPGYWILVLFLLALGITWMYVDLAVAFLDLFW